MRAAFDVLLDLDEAMANVIVRSAEPMLAAIKLAWWRERLQELDEGKVPAEPRLQAAAAELLPRGITGERLAVLAEGWSALLQEPADHTGVFERGAVILGILAGLLNQPSPNHDVGLLFGCTSAARRGLPIALDGAVAAVIARGNSPRSTVALRAVTMLGALAARDVRHGGPPFEPEATPGRAWALFRHRLTGRL